MQGTRVRGSRRRPLFIAGAGVVAGLASALGAFVWWRRRWFAVAVAGGSMAPTFAEGDFVLVHRQPIVRDDGACGLVVCLRGPDERLLLKRIVGIPGDSLRIGSAVQVAGRPLLEPYAHGATPHQQFRSVSELGADEYLVLGDNRAGSTDSRDFGPVRAGTIKGVARFRYWPPERFGRIRRTPRRFVPVDLPLATSASPTTVNEN